MKMFLSILSLLPLVLFSQKWEANARKIVGWTFCAGAGIVHGFTDAYHARPDVFEKAWGVEPLSFFGSRAWERNYENGVYRNGDGSVNRHKPDAWNTFRDVWHFGNAAQKVLLVGGTFTIATTKQKSRHKLLDVGIGMVLYSASANLAYKIRYR